MAPAAPAAELVAGTVYGVPVLDGRWTAYQLVTTDGERPTIVALDWLDERPPTLEEARAAGLLRVTHHNWKGDLEYLYVRDRKPPRGWRAVGVLPVPDLGPCLTFGGWPTEVTQVVAERRWLTEIPEAVRAAYKAATSTEPVRLALGAMDLELPTSTHRLALGSSRDPLSPETKLTWSALDRLLRLSQLDFHGRGAGLVDYLQGHLLIDDLRWTNHGSAALDLSRTRLRKLSIAVEGPLTLALADRVTELIVDGNAGALTVTQPAGGARLTVHVVGDRAQNGLPRGLPRLRRLELSSTGTVDAAAIAAAYPNLVSLTIRAASEIISVARLAELRGLQHLTFYTCYRFDVASLPSSAVWREIEVVRIHGHRKSDAKLLGERLGGAPIFDLAGAKADAWLAANLDNPFREWIDRNARAGKLAAAAWKKARGALPPPPAGKKTEAVMRTFVDTFNAIDAKQGIDTADREEIAGAFDTLARVGGVDEKTAAKWLDAWRDF